MEEIPTRLKYAEHFFYGPLAQTGSATGFYGVYRIIREQSFTNRYSSFLSLCVFSMNLFPQRNPLVKGSNPLWPANSKHIQINPE